jgi:hypothetical protein
MLSMKNFLKYLGLLIALGSTAAMMWHRFSYPDMTQVRWLIEFWYIWLVWFGSVILGGSLYLIGDGKSTKVK